MFRIKICGITNSGDGVAAAAAGADAIGLNFFNKSRRFVEPAVAREIARTLPASVKKVGVFVNHDASEVTTIAESVGLDAIQLHGDEPPAFLAQLPLSVVILRAYRCGNDGLAPLAHYLDVCGSSGRLPDAVLVDADAGTEYGGTGRSADWNAVAAQRNLLRDLPLILAGGLTPQNVSAAIAAVEPDGVDVASGVESQPGVKDNLLVTSFVAAAQAAFAGR